MATMTTSALRIGFIGLGIMGAPMAGHLLAAGHSLFATTRRQVPAALVEAGIGRRQHRPSVALTFLPTATPARSRRTWVLRAMWRSVQ